MATVIDKKKIALIHVARAKVGMTEIEYRDLLAGVGVSSSKKLSPGAFKQVMDQFNQLGFKSNFSHRARRRPAKGKQPLMGKIGAILADMNLPWTYADGIAKKRFKVSALQWCNEDQLYKIAQMLAVHQRRQGQKQNGTMKSRR